MHTNPGWEKEKNALFAHMLSVCRLECPYAPNGWCNELCKTSLSLHVLGLVPIIGLVQMKRNDKDAPHGEQLKALLDYGCGANVTAVLQKYAMRGKEHRSAIKPVNELRLVIENH